jgi:hypothetical protein
MALLEKMPWLVSRRMPGILIPTRNDVGLIF